MILFVFNQCLFCLRNDNITQTHTVFCYSVSASGFVMFILAAKLVQMFCCIWNILQDRKSLQFIRKLSNIITYILFLLSPSSSQLGKHLQVTYNKVSLGVLIMDKSDIKIQNKSKLVMSRTMRKMLYQAMCLRCNWLTLAWLLIYASCPSILRENIVTVSIQNRVNRFFIIDETVSHLQIRKAYPSLFNFFYMWVVLSWYSKWFQCYYK